MPMYRREVIDSDDADDIGPVTITTPPVTVYPPEITYEPPVAPPDIIELPVAPPEITAPPETEIAALPDTPARDSARPIRRRQKPTYLQDYII